ncbi:hypothetical protein DMA11_21815 [Marinilabiliaceae bacterium JC017]|nr:hypothetical protein DMA11_21815 [Marinilabiliaceae bacterium JC017]
MKTTNLSQADSLIVTQVKEVLHKLLRSQENGNITDFAECFAHDDDLVNIGTDLDEVWYDWPTFFSWMKEAITNRQGYTITEKDTRIVISNDKHVAWYSQLIDTCLETKGEITRLEGFRHTGVLEQRHGQWVIVQSHVSIPYTEPEADEEEQEIL